MRIFALLANRLYGNVGSYVYRESSNHSTTSFDNCGYKGQPDDYKNHWNCFKNPHNTTVTVVTVAKPALTLLNAVGEHNKHSHLKIIVAWVSSCFAS